MPESGTSGSVRGASSNGRSYRDKKGWSGSAGAGTRTSSRLQSSPNARGLECRSRGWRSATV